MPLSYLSPKTEVHESKIDGHGLFAIAEVLTKTKSSQSERGSHCRQKSCVKKSRELGPVEIQIHDDLFIAPVTEEEREPSMLYVNHSLQSKRQDARRRHVCGHAPMFALVKNSRIVGP